MFLLSSQIPQTWAYHQEFYQHANMLAVNIDTALAGMLYAQPQLAAAVVVMLAEQTAMRYSRTTLTASNFYEILGSFDDLGEDSQLYQTAYDIFPPAVWEDTFVYLTQRSLVAAG